MLYKKYYGYGLGIAMRYSSSRDIAKEILSDSFLKAFTNLKSYTKSMPFKFWLRRILINTAIDCFRRNKHHREMLSVDALSEVEFADNVFDDMMAEEIIHLLQQLPDHFRIAFNLYEIEGFSHKEIAVRLNISESTSRSNLTRAKEKLRELVNHLYHYEARVQ